MSASPLPSALTALLSWVLVATSLACADPARPALARPPLARELALAPPPGEPATVSAPEPALSTAPCEAPTAVARDLDDRLLIGCAEGGGLWIAARAAAPDRRRPWRRLIDSHALDVQAMAEGPEGVLVTGRDWDGGALAWRVLPTATVVARALVHLDDLAALDGTDGIDHRSSGRAIAGDGARLLLSFEGGTRLALSEDDGATWSLTEAPAPDEEQDEHNALIAVAEGFVSAGAPRGGEPTVYRPPEGERVPAAAHTVVAALQGEVAALTALGVGETLLAGGAGFTEDGDLIGFLARSTDGGQSWGPLAWDPDLLPEAIGADEDGRHVVVVGARATEPREGFLLLSDDGAARFSPYYEGLPALHAVTVGEGRFAAVGGGVVVEGAVGEAALGLATPARRR
jgi:hypothetical protein